jgi:hypothetical protein
LGVLLGRLELMSESLQDGRLPSSELEPKALILELNAELWQHFTAEEGAGYFGTLVMERPLLIPRIQALYVDHRTILKMTTALVTTAQEAARREDFVLEARRLLARFRDHERAESLVLQEFLVSEPPAQT